MASGASDKLKEYLKHNWLSLLVIVISLIASVLSAFFTYSYANDSVADLGIQLRTQVVSGIETSLKAQVGQRTSDVHLATRLLGERLVDMNDDQHLSRVMRFLWHYFTHTATIATFYVGNTEGRALGYTVTPEGPLAILSYKPVASGAWPVLDDFGSFNYSQPSVFPPDDVDFRDFPGYVQAKETLKEFWMPPFAVLQDPTTITLTYGAPVLFDKNNASSFCCAVFVDLTLATWKQMLQSFTVSKHGKIFITEQTGLLLADSTDIYQAATIGAGDNPFYLPVYLPAAVNNTDKTLAAAAKRLEKKHGFDFSEKILDKFQFDGQTQLLLASPVTLEPNLHLVVVIVVPESDFNSRITKGRKLAIAFTSVAFAFFVIKYIPWNFLYKKLRSTQHSSSKTSVVPLVQEEGNK